MKTTLAIVALSVLIGCSAPQESDNVENVQSRTGVSIAKATVPVGSDGLTVEQANVKRRIEFDNKPGSIKYLYVLSAYTGDIVLQSVVKGKVTSSGKRLTPSTVSAGYASGEYGSGYWGVPITIPGSGGQRTTEVLQDDGTFGSSVEYLYWWDTNGVYHQLYPSGGQVIQISDQPQDFGRVEQKVKGR